LPAEENPMLSVLSKTSLLRSVSALRVVLLAALAGLTVMLLPATALAAGNFTVKTSEVSESSGEWHVKVRIDLARPPGMMHIPMRFTFAKQAVDERAIMEKGAEPVHHRMVLDVTPKQIQSMDVDFADPSGKVFKSTYFEFDLRRDGGYFEAGEYQVSLSGPDGDVGGSQKLVLKGDNPPVYRGAMDFTAEKGSKQKGPKIENVSSGVDAGAKVAQNDDPNGGAGAATGEVQAQGSGGDMIPKDAFNKTAEEEAVHGRPGGCGCVAAGVDGGAGPLAGVDALLGLGLVAVRGARRRGR
jgi:hypothetical protein